MSTATQQTEIKQNDSIFDTVGKTIQKVEAIKRSESNESWELGLASKESEMPSKNHSSGVSQPKVTRFTFTDGTQIEI